MCNNHESTLVSHHALFSHSKQHRALRKALFLTMILVFSLVGTDTQRKTAGLSFTCL